MDVAVYDLIKSVEDKKPMKGTTSFDLKEDGVSLATSGGFIDDIQSDIDKAKKEIVDGKIKVKDTP